MRVLLVGLPFLLGLVVGQCGAQEGAPEVAEVVREDVPDHESWGTHFYVSQDGRPRMVITADYMAEYEREDSTYMLLTGMDSSRVTLRLFDDEGQPSATLTAQRIYYYEDEKRLDAQGDVVVQTPGGRRLETEDLRWDEQARTVTTPGFVRITTEQEVVQGYALEADEDLATYRLRRVTGRRRVEEE
ncbi:MAG: hypothetical protein KatS3mg044_0252 [Rhodothermaceae bacterium]|nr:MAG: LPS export ABC transporter periplasmic protein LptC [Bacteroidota bacterium]GIV61386.1 MAG: hypothetical protein KatS3mg044_0252 [Rhodothermaceae bacterium]